MYRLSQIPCQHQSRSQQAELHSQRAWDRWTEISTKIQREKPGSNTRDSPKIIGGETWNRSGKNCLAWYAVKQSSGWVPICLLSGHNEIPLHALSTRFSFKDVGLCVGVYQLLHLSQRGNQMAVNCLACSLRLGSFLLNCDKNWGLQFWVHSVLGKL